MIQVVLAFILIGAGYLTFGWIVSKIWDFAWDD